MTKDEAFRILELAKGWNVGQRSFALAWRGERTLEDDVLDAKRETVRKAWEVVRGEQ